MNQTTPAIERAADALEFSGSEDLTDVARATLTAALDAVDWPDTLAGHMTITLTDMHRCACHEPLAPSNDRYMAEQAHLMHLSTIIRTTILGSDQ